MFDWDLLLKPLAALGAIIALFTKIVKMERERKKDLDEIRESFRTECASKEDVKRIERKLEAMEERLYTIATTNAHRQ